MFRLVVGLLSWGGLVLVACGSAAAAPVGSFTEFTIPTASSGPEGIAAGPDDALWFTENNTNNIGRVTPAGSLTEFGLPTASSQPFGIAAGPDGNLWFTEFGTRSRTLRRAGRWHRPCQKFGRLTPFG